MTGTLRIVRSDTDTFTIEAIGVNDGIELVRHISWPAGAVLDIEVEDSVGPISLYQPDAPWVESEAVEWNKPSDEPWTGERSEYEHEIDRYLLESEDA